MQLSHWKFVLLWQGTGMLCALGISAIDAFIVNARRGVGIVGSALMVPGDIAFVIVGVLLITPVSLLVLWIWVKMVARYPQIEPSFARTIIHLSALAIGLALAAGVLSNWEALRSESQRETFVRNSIAVGRSVLFWVVIGVVLPRVLVRALRPGRSAPRIAA